MLTTSGETAERLGLRPLARLHSFAVTGSDPLLMLTGVIPATERVLRRAGLDLADIDLFEVNEAFAGVVLAWLRETGAAPAKVNVNGGAIALGHPLAARVGGRCPPRAERRASRPRTGTAVRPRAAGPTSGPRCGHG